MGFGSIKSTVDIDQLYQNGIMTENADANARGATFGILAFASIIALVTCVLSQIEDSKSREQYCNKRVSLLLLAVVLASDLALLLAGDRDPAAQGHRGRGAEGEAAAA